MVAAVRAHASFGARILTGITRPPGSIVPPPVTSDPSPWTPAGEGRLANERPGAYDRCTPPRLSRSKPVGTHRERSGAHACFAAHATSLCSPLLSRHVRKGGRASSRAGRMAPWTSMGPCRGKTGVCPPTPDPTPGRGRSRTPARCRATAAGPMRSAARTAPRARASWSAATAPAEPAGGPTSRAAPATAATPGSRARSACAEAAAAPGRRAARGRRRARGAAPASAARAARAASSP